MWSFQYKHGDRPLEGYTIQRAAGRGGFGEVYYATSDAGREVALKVVTGYEQIELRGISQCMNLKSPHLVTIFDVKHNAQGRPFVIMEYVSGPSLRQLLDENPSGLGEQKAAFFLREIAKGLTFLHDCGIVHRDLKPGNIFYENGYVKIGDYGLSKAISTTQHSGQTVTVGTVHYMAPEVGAGKYDRGIDIYAMGAVLYEMLTGTPPYVGASPSEVLLKHLSGEPDCRNISEPYASVIKKAMSKDPTQRYQNVQEMVEAVFGAEHVRQSMSVFSPEDLSVVAGRVARQVEAGAAASGDAAAGPAVATRPAVEVHSPWQRMRDGVERLDDRINAGINRRFANIGADPSRDFSVPLEDPLSAGSRWTLALVSVVIVAAATQMVVGVSHRNEPPAFVFVIVAMLGAILGLGVWRPRVLPRIDAESLGLRRLATIGLAAAGMLVTAGWSMQYSTYGQPGIWIPMLASLLVLDSKSCTSPERRERVRLGHAIAAGFVGFIASAMLGHPSAIPAAFGAGMALAMQVLTPWRSPSSRMASAFVPGAAPGAGLAATEPMRPPATPRPPMPPVPPVLPLGNDRFWNVPVHRAVPFVWFGLFALALSLGIAFFVGAGVGSNSDFGPFMAGGGAFVIFSLLCFIRGFARRYYGVWPYLLRPLVVTLCAITLWICIMIMATENLGSGEMAVATFFIVFPSIAAVVAMFIPGYTRIVGPPPMPGQAPEADSSAGSSSGVSPFKRLTALLLSAIWFFGAAGIQRFYVGKIGTGILWLLTGGLFGIGQIVDIINIVAGNFTDADGRKLLIWDDSNEAVAVSGAAGVGSAIKLPRLPRRSTGQSHVNGLLSALASLLLFAGTLICVALALDVSGAVAAGVFDPTAAASIERDVFNGYAAWPTLVNRVAVVGAGVVMLLALSTLILARRRAGVGHIFRGVVGAAGVIGATCILSTGARSLDWHPIAELTAGKHVPEALNMYLDAWKPGIAVLALSVFLVSMVILAWPAPHRRAAQAPEAGEVR